MPILDYSQYETIEMLRTIIRETEEEIERRRTADRERFMAEAQQIAEQYGMSAEDFFQLPQAKRSPNSTAAAKKYQNPDNPHEIYESKRGARQPEWFKQKLGAGVTRESMEVSGEEY